MPVKTKCMLSYLVYICSQFFSLEKIHVQNVSFDRGLYAHFSFFFLPAYVVRSKNPISLDICTGFVKVNISLLDEMSLLKMVHIPFM